MKNVFISYRRDDSLATAGRIRDRLGAELGSDRIFVDVEDIEPGLDFVQVLERRLAECGVLLVIIGPNWLNAQDGKGNRRLHADDDFVRTEIRTALGRNITVIPVLIDGAQMPSREALPPDLHALTRRNALELRNSLFSSDAARLVRVVASQPGMQQRRGWQLAASAIAASALLGGAGYFAWPWLTGLTGQPTTQQAAVVAPPPSATALAPPQVKTAPSPPSAIPAPQKAAAAPSSAPETPPVPAQIERLRAALAASAQPLQVGFRGGNTVKLGQQVIFEITSPVTGRLIMLDLNAAGQLTQIFPNGYAPSEEISQIEAQRMVSVPGPDYGFTGFKAVEPLGRGRLIAIVQPREAGAPLDVVRAELARKFDPIRSPSVYLQAIIDQVERGGSGTSRWGFALSDYEIVR